MKIQELLNDKKSIESKINTVKEGKKEIERSKNDCNDLLSIRIFGGGGGYENVRVPHDDIESILNNRIEKLEAELEPINKKLEAIELMLNS